MARAIDRRGRSLIDLLGMYIEQQSIDTTSPAGRLMFQVTGAFAEFERAMIRQRIRAGLKRAVEQGKPRAASKGAPLRKHESRANCGAARACWRLLGVRRWHGHDAARRARNGRRSPFRRHRRGRVK